MKDVEPWFFYYPAGIEEALYVVLSTFDYPSQYHSGFSREGCSPLLHDADAWFDAQERSNALPKDYGHIMETLEFAASLLDEIVYHTLRGVFGDTTKFQVSDVSMLPSRFCYAIQCQH